MFWFFKKKKLGVKLDYSIKIIHVEGKGYLHDIAKLINDEGQKQNYPQNIATLEPSGTDGVFIRLNDGWQFSRGTIEDVNFTTRKKFRKKVITSSMIMSSEWVLKGE